MNKFKSTRLLTILFLSVAICLTAASVPEDTVIAKFGGQQLTVEKLNNRINKIPAMYRQKYSTPEGKIKLLWFSNYPSGNFTIATLTFKAVSDGNTTVSLNNIVVSMSGR